MRKLLYPMVIFLVLISVGTTYAQKDKTGQTGEVLFEEDFESGSVSADISQFVPWKVAPANVDGVQSSVLRGKTSAENAEGFLLTTGYDWTDYAYEVKFRAAQPATISMFTRLPETLCESGYGFYFLNNNTVELDGIIPGCDDFRVLGVEDFSFPLNEWMTVRMESLGATTSVYIDDTLMVEGTDTEDVPMGSVGFLVFGATTVEIDYIRVTSLSGGNTTAGNASSSMGGMGSGNSGNTGNTGNTGSNTGNTTTTTTVSLTSFAEDHSAAQAELASLGFVPAGGVRLFTEPLVFADGNSGYVPLARRSNIQNSVFSAELSMSQNSPDAGCQIITRLGTDTNAAVGLTAAGEVFVLDFTSATGPATTNQLVALGLDMTQPHHVIAIFMDDEVTVFVNGELAFDRVPVSISAGSFGYGVFGTGRCEARNVWVYEYD